jgi:hypothetical protein
LHGQRAVHTFRVSIMEKASKIIELLAKVEPAEMSAYHVTKLIYPMGKLNRLDMGVPIHEQNVPCGAQLVLMGQKDFMWDINRKGPNVQVCRSLLF